jgi:folate-binding protein YgfZ
MTPSPLQPLHEAAQAEFQNYGPIPMVLTFGEPQAEYAAIRKSAAILDAPQWGILRLTGRDRLPFLNNLLTNQTWDKSTKTGLSPGSGVYAFFLNTKGRILADMNVIERPDHTLLCMDARLVESIQKTFDRYLFSEQVTMTSALDSHHTLFLTGPSAAEALRTALDSDVPDLAPLGSFTVTLGADELTLYRDDICGVPGFVLIVPRPAVADIWTRFTANPSDSSDDLRFRGLARPMGWAAFNAARIEAGRPLFGIDFAEPPVDQENLGVLPADTGQMLRAVSHTKGCYLGQEIVARMHARNQIPRQLAGIRMESDALPIASSKIYDEADNEIGGVTSSTVSPVLSNAALCLGYLKKPFFTPGATVRIPAEGAMHMGKVVDLPFVTT